MTSSLLNKRAVLWPFPPQHKKESELWSPVFQWFHQRDTVASTFTPRTIAIIALVVGQFTIALGVFCIKLSVDEMGSLGTTFTRFWMAALILCFWDAVHHRKANPTQTQPQPNSALEPQTVAVEAPSTPLTYTTYLLFALCGLMFAGCLVLWAWSLQYTTVANSTLMHDLSPLFATIFGWLIFKHHFSKRFLGAVGLTLIGVVTIGFEDFQVGMSNFIGDGIALSSAILLALYCLLVGQLRQRFTAMVVLQWTCLIGASGILPLILLTSNPLFPTTMFGWLAVTGVVCFSQIIGQGLTAFSLKQLSSEFVSLFLPLEAVFAAFIAWVGWNQPLTLLNCIGFVFVLGGIYLALLSPGTTETKDAAA
ncbi:MAG: DMT family transporter [Leptolyngbyaceae bacterium]|nr:DMT family transporter [Leptolyngbyaceae bacterium]